VTDRHATISVTIVLRGCLKIGKQHWVKQTYQLVSWSLTSLFSTNMAISETKQTYQVSRNLRETPAFWTPISRSSAASSKSPLFCKQSRFPFNSTAKIAPVMHKNSPFKLKNRKKILGMGHRPQTHPQTSPVSAAA